MRTVNSDNGLLAGAPSAPVGLTDLPPVERVDASGRAVVHQGGFGSER